VIHHRYYALSYREDLELAEWVAYELTKESLAVPNVKRTDWFTEDQQVSTGSANYHDYKGSGYTRGHMAPAGDMAFNLTAMEESFYMSNISPQKWLFNSGIWRELEENIRDWAMADGRLFVVTGPVLDKKQYARIGRNQVAVPDAFFKVLLDVDDPELKSLAFIIPNEKSTEVLNEYMMSVDDLEERTGLDFFGELLSEKLQQQLESHFDEQKWPLSEKRYQLRINKWNR
jgi:endonuclease G